MPEASSARRPRVPASFVALTDRMLPLWFLAWSAIRVYQLSWTGASWDTSFFGRDFKIYRSAALAVLNGTDPWAASATWNGTDWHFAALPTAAQLFIPFALLPEAVGLAAFLALSVGAVWLPLRRLRLPIWWLLFPPLMEGLLAANPQILLFGLLIVGWPWARAVATALKVYAVVPVIARREGRALLVIVGAVLASVALGPSLWTEYAGEFGAISGRIAAESQGGVSATLLLDPKVFGSALPATGIVRSLPGLLLYGLIALLVVSAAVRDVRAAGWVAVPLLWPAAEYHLATLAIPAARRLSIWVIAIATPPTYLLGLILLTYEISAGRRAIVDEPPAEPLVSWIAAVLPGRARGALRLPAPSAPSAPAAPAPAAPPAGTRPTSAS
jgi:hypothetical protein